MIGWSIEVRLPRLDEQRLEVDPVEDVGVPLDLVRAVYPCVDDGERRRAIRTCLANVRQCAPSADQNAAYHC